MDQLTQMTTYTATGGLLGQWLLGMSTLVTVLLLFLLSYVQTNSSRGQRRMFTWIPRELVGQAGIGFFLTVFDYLYFTFRDMRFVAGLVDAGQTNVTLAMYYIDATNWRFTGSVIAWICKTAFADFIMLLRAAKLFQNNDRLGGTIGYYAVLVFLSILYMGTVAAGIITWVGLLRPTASTFDDLLENSATFFMGIHCGYNVFVTLLISFVYWRAMSHQFKMMTIAQLALRSFSAGNMLYTILIAVLVILYQKQLLFVYFWYDITQPLMTMSFTVPMLLTAMARVLPVDKSMKSSNFNGVRAVSGGIAVSVRRDQEVDNIHNIHEMDSMGDETSKQHNKGLESDDDISAGP